MKFFPTQTPNAASLAFAATLSLTSAQDALRIESLDELVVEADRVDVEWADKVSAFRTDTLLRDTPQSATIFTADQIQRQGIDSIGDLIDYTPGVNTSQGEGHRDAVVFRGVRSTADFFIDGIRDDVQYYRSLYNIDQVEVIKGPNALTFGRGGIGGVLNRTLKRPQIGERFTQTLASYDTFGAYQAQFDTNIALNEKSAFRLNTHFDSLNNHRDLFEGERFGISPSFIYKPSEDTELRFTYEHANHDRFIDRGIPNDGRGGVADELSRFTFGDRNLNFNDLDAHTFQVSLEHQFTDNWKGRLIGFYGTYDKVYGNYFASDFDPVSGEVEFDGYIDATDRQNFILTGDLTGEFSTGSIKHKVLAGAEFGYTSSDQNRLNNVWSSNGDDQQFFSIAGGFSLRNGVFRDSTGTILDTGAFTDLNDDTETTINVYSAFLQDEIALSDQWNLILGVRFDNFDIDVLDNRTGNLTSSSDQQITPRLGLVFKPVESVSLYGGYSESFLPASGEQFTDLVDGSGLPVNDLDPNTASNLEVGLKWDLAENLSLSLAGFRIVQTNVANGPIPGTVERIDSEIMGGEAQLIGQLTDKWFVSLGYSFLEGENTETGTDLRELPRNTISLWNNFQVNEKLSLGVGLLYQDESFVDNAATIVLPSYTRIDASARYDFTDDFGVQLNIENLFDTDYFPNSHNNDNITVAAPINARITFVKWF